jgi:hypothetical protein
MHQMPSDDGRDWLTHLKALLLKTLLHLVEFHPNITYMLQSAMPEHSVYPTKRLGF